MIPSAVFNFSATLSFVISSESTNSNYDVEVLYELPMMLLDQHMDDLVLEHLRIEAPQPNMSEWESLIERVKGFDHEITIALVGKYTQLPDAYLSVNEALRHAGYYENSVVNIEFVDSEEITKDNVAEKRSEEHTSELQSPS